MLRTRRCQWRWPRRRCRWERAIPRTRRFPGKRAIEAQGNSATFGGDLQEPAITSAADSITAERAAATFSTPLQEP